MCTAGSRLFPLVGSGRLLEQGDLSEIHGGFAEKPGEQQHCCTGPSQQMERIDEGRLWKQKRAYEKRWRDPDDVYIDVEQREEERKKQGLPPRIGIVPHSAVAAEEKRVEEEQEQKQKPSAKRRK